jgi:hypothetical protein
VSGKGMVRLVCDCSSSKTWLFPIDRALFLRAVRERICCAVQTGRSGKKGYSGNRCWWRRVRDASLPELRHSFDFCAAKRSHFERRFRID